VHAPCCHLWLVRLYDFSTFSHNKTEKEEEEEEEEEEKGN
jgi:hypothetical protein